MKASTIILEGVSGIFAIVVMTLLLSQTVADNETSLNFTINETSLPFIGSTILDVYVGENQSNLTVSNTEHLEISISEINNGIATLEVNYEILDENYDSNTFIEESITIENESEEINSTIVSFNILNDDEDNDGFGFNDCNDSNSEINPDAEEIPDNEIDENCDGNVEMSTLLAGLSDNKVNIGESIEATIIAPEGATIEYTICRPDYPDNPDWISDDCVDLVKVHNGNNLEITETEHVGSYSLDITINTGEISYNKELFYQVENSIQVNMQGDLTRVEGEKTTLLVAATGGITPYTYTWTYASETITGGKFEKTLTAGNHNINLKVEDGAGNYVEKVYQATIEELLVLNVKVRSKEGNNAISGAEIDVEDESLDSDSNGAAQFELVEDTYKIIVSKSGYETEKLDYELEKDSTVTINLTKLDVEAPVITLLTSNGASTESSSIKVEYKVVDEEAVSCTIFTKEDGWYTKGSTAEISDASDTLKQSFTLSDQNLNEIIYRIECQDERSNKASSAERKVLINNANEVRTQGEEKKPLADELYDLLDVYNNFGAKERKAAELMNLEGKLKDDIKLVERGIRDINDIIFRRDLTEEEKESERLAIGDKIDEIYQNTIKSIQVNDEQRVIKYPTDDQLKKMFEEYYDRELSDREFEGLKSRQEKLSSSTSIYELTVEYLSGTSEELVLIGKKITFDDSEAKSQDILALYSNNVKFLLSDLEKVKENFYKISGFETAILVKGSYEDTAIIFLPEKIPLSTQVTGKVSFTSGNKPVWAGIIFAGIILLFVVVKLNSRRIAVMYYHFRKNSAYHKIKIMVHDAEKYLDKEDYEKASLIYREIKMSYDKLADFDKNRLYEEISLLSDLLNKSYLEMKLESIKENPGRAKQELERAKHAYNKLRKELKDIVYPQLKEVINKYGGAQ